MNNIDKFVKKYENRSINTVKNYRSQLNQYFDFLKVDPDTYFDNGHDYKKDIRKYWDNKVRHRPPLVRSYILSVINSFLRRMGEIDIEKEKPFFWQDLKDEEKGKRAISEDHVPSSDELKKILIHANAMEKTIFLIAASSGMRIGEIIQLTKDDIKTDENPCRIHIPGSITKNGEMRDTFITNEAKESYHQWMNVRMDYLTKIDGKLNFKQVKGKYRRDKNDPRIFPVTYVTCSLRWNKLLKNAKFIDDKGKGKDKNTGRIKLHIHCLRKFAKTRMLLTMPQGMCNYMIGHTGYLQREYEKYEVFQLVPEYKKAMRNLLVFGSSDVDVQIRKEVDELRKENEQLRRDVQSLTITVTKTIAEKFGEVIDKENEIYKKKTLKSKKL